MRVLGPRYGGHPRPAWWALCLIAVLLVAVVGLVETHVGDEGLRKVLEILVVVAGFGLIAVWLRRTRIALELERGQRPT